MHQFCIRIQSNSQFIYKNYPNTYLKIVTKEEKKDKTNKKETYANSVL